MRARARARACCEMPGKPPTHRLRAAAGLACRLAVGVSFGSLGTPTCEKLSECNSRILNTGGPRFGLRFQVKVSTLIQIRVLVVCGCPRCEAPLILHPRCNFENSFNLALGIGIQNFPEGAWALAKPRSTVRESLLRAPWIQCQRLLLRPTAPLVAHRPCGVHAAAPLRRWPLHVVLLRPVAHVFTAAQTSTHTRRTHTHIPGGRACIAGSHSRPGCLLRRGLCYAGQLSGMVEPIAGYAGAKLVQEMEPILPYAMAFAVRHAGPSSSHNTQHNTQHHQSAAPPPPWGLPGAHQPTPVCCCCPVCAILPRVVARRAR